MTTEEHKVFLVMSGGGFEVGVDAVFSTSEAAEKCAEVIGGWVDEFELDVIPGYPLGFPEGKRVYYVLMNLDGQVTGCGHCWSQAPFWEVKDIEGNRLGFYLWASDETEASKLANEKRIKLIEMKLIPVDTYKQHRYSDEIKRI